MIKRMTIMVLKLKFEETITTYAATQAPLQPPTHTLIIHALIKKMHITFFKYHYKNATFLSKLLLTIILSVLPLNN